MSDKKENTVFIIGAGANVPFEFPTARSLRKEIITNFGHLYLNSFFKENRKFPSYGVQSEFVKQFIKDFNLSSIYSIDYFIARNPKYESIGKDAIILMLSQYEQNSRFRENTTNNNEDWYSLLYNKMIEDLKNPSSFNDISSVNYSFITFNYDRSLEFFLTESIFSSFENLNSSQALRETMAQIPIKHVYGSLGNIPFSNNDASLRFGASLTKEQMILIRDEILTVSEHNKLDEDITELITEADKIFFLGFAFDRINLRNIGLPKLFKSHQKIYATSIGLNDRFIFELKDYIIKQNLLHQRNELSSNTSPLHEDNFVFENVGCFSLLAKYL